MPELIDILAAGFVLIVGLRLLWVLWLSPSSSTQIEELEDRLMKMKAEKEIKDKINKYK